MKLFLSIGFISRKKTEFALGLDEDMTSSFKISKALNGFDLGFNLENDFFKTRKIIMLTYLYQVNF